MKYYVYIIYSHSKDLYYIGHKNDLDDRLFRHNNNRNKFTKGKGPWSLVASLECSSKSEAYRLELKLKSFKNPLKAISYLKKLVQSIPTLSGGHRFSRRDSKGGILQFPLLFFKPQISIHKSQINSKY